MRGRWGGGLSGGLACEKVSGKCLSIIIFTQINVFKKRFLQFFFFFISLWTMTNVCLKGVYWSAGRPLSLSSSLSLCLSVSVSLSLCLSLCVHCDTLTDSSHRAGEQIMLYNAVCYLERFVEGRNKLACI